MNRPALPRRALLEMIGGAALISTTSILVKLAKLTIPEKQTKEEEWPLDERFLDMPAFALEQCKNVMERMATLSRDTLLMALGTIETYDAKTISKVISAPFMIGKYFQSALTSISILFCKTKRLV